MPSWNYMRRNKPVTPILPKLLLGWAFHPSRATDGVADLIPRVPSVVCQRYAGHKWQVTAVRVGALTEDNARVSPSTLNWNVGSRRPAESVREQLRAKARTLVFRFCILVVVR